MFRRYRDSYLIVKRFNIKKECFSLGSGSFAKTDMELCATPEQVIPFGVEKASKKGFRDSSTKHEYRHESSKSTRRDHRGNN